MNRDSRGRFMSAVQIAASPGFTNLAEIPLLYPYLSSLAVTPGRDPYDNEHGGYGGSILGYSVGLHIHTDGDGWGETEPERPVHFIVEHSKLAAVYPDHLQVITVITEADDEKYLSETKKSWLQRLRADHKTAGLRIHQRLNWTDPIIG